MKEFTLRIEERANLERAEQEEFLQGMKSVFLDEQIE